MSEGLSLSHSFSDFLAKRVALQGLALSKPKDLAPTILQLSNQFIDGVFDSYWHDSRDVAAYLAYFHALNVVRARRVMSEAVRIGFLEGATRIVDWGCGAGAATWALIEAVGARLDGATLIGIDREAVFDEYSAWVAEAARVSGVKRIVIETHRDGSSVAERKADTLIASYSINEGGQLPTFSPSVQRLIFIEPSTHQAARALMQHRTALIAQGFHAWAPCTHQHSCPLLMESRRDWCHDRAEWEQPPWYRDLEKALPMKNGTLPYSYLLMSREPAPVSLHGQSRITGDQLKEKGKTRQLICAGPSRNFLSWLDRDEVHLDLVRGDRVVVHSPEQKGTELRVTKADQVVRVTD